MLPSNFQLKPSIHTVVCLCSSCSRSYLPRHSIIFPIFSLYFVPSQHFSPPPVPTEWEATPGGILFSRLLSLFLFFFFPGAKKLLTKLTVTLIFPCVVCSPPAGRAGGCSPLAGPSDPYRERSAMQKEEHRFEQRK